MARGYNSFADIIRTTVDGKDLNDLWSEFSAALNIRNERRTALAALFTFPTTLAADEVAQATNDEEFEEASEYGVPQSLRVSPSTIRVGFPFKWFDLAARYTWLFLADASAAQVESVHASALEADNKLVFKHVMSALFRNISPGVNEDGTEVKPLWNGDGVTPPPYAGNTFSDTHNHYIVSGAATLDGGDLELLADTVQHHGYGLADNGDTLVILMNPEEAKIARGFRSGVNGAAYDFIPADDAPAFITDESIVGDRPAGTFQGLKVVGSYGNALLVEDYMIPAGYVVSVSTAGSGSARNPLAIREHKRTEMQGLIQIPGAKEYPLIDSYYARGLGVGVRHRGAAAVMQIKAAGAYTVPAGF